MNESTFKEILDRLEQGIATEEEKKLMEAWLDNVIMTTSETFKNKAEKQALKHKLRASVRKEAGLPEKETTHRRIPGTYIRKPLRLAASLLLLIIAGYFSWTAYTGFIAAGYAVVRTLSGDKISKVLLSDGSIIWLKPQSSLSYPRKFREAGFREVTIQGEALFEVAKKADQPFIVRANDITTTVLGTSFHIKTQTAGTEVAVLTGKVKVQVNSTDKIVELLPLEKVIYAPAEGQLTKIAREEVMPVAELVAGTEYDMNFENATVSDLAKRISDKFDVKVRVAGNMGRCLITADFTDQSLQSTLEMVTEVLNATFEVTKEEVVLSGQNCQ